jgi:hypothetical protein
VLLFGDPSSKALQNQRKATMSDDQSADIDQADFIYSPEQPLTLEMRIELLEYQMAEVQRHLASLNEKLNWLRLIGTDGAHA